MQSFNEMFNDWSFVSRSMNAGVFLVPIMHGAISIVGTSTVRCVFFISVLTGLEFANELDFSTCT